MKRICLLAALALLTACTPNPPKTPPLHVTTGISKSTGDVYIYSPMNVMAPSKVLPMRVMWQLNTEIARRDQALTHTLRINVLYASPKRSHYVSVIDDKGVSLKFALIGKAGKPCPDGSCKLSDTIDVTLPDADLRAHAQTGWPFKLTTKSKLSIPATIAPEIIKLQLDETDKAIKAPPTLK